MHETLQAVVDDCIVKCKGRGSPAGWYKVAFGLCRYFFQGVHMLLTLGSSAEGVGTGWKPDEKRSNKLVFIGRNLNREELLADFKACIV